MVSGVGGSFGVNVLTHVVWKVGGTAPVTVTHHAQLERGGSVLGGVYKFKNVASEYAQVRWLMKFCFLSCFYLPDLH